VSKMLQSIRIIKFFAWEPQFIIKIREARAVELAALVKTYLSGIIGSAISNSPPLVVSLVSFGTYTLIAGRDLDASTAFTSLALFNMLAQPMVILPDYVQLLVRALASVKRIADFLEEEELDRYRADFVAGTPAASVKIGFTDASFTWADSTEDNTGSEDEERTFTLRGINVEFPTGALSTVCGGTGAGKSSLVQALLGEMKQTEGKTYLPDSRSATVDPKSGLSLSTAYVAQTAWIMNATVRENIIFGSRFDPERYSRIVEACALTRDFETLEGGDLTEIGEKGINLSGGQKQRISLARAAYSTASIVLLDDPLSAVDAPTARHLFDKCICGFMAGRTRILVTHATGLALPRTDFLVVLKSGTIAAQGAVATVIDHPAVAAIVSKETLAAGEERVASEVKSDVPETAHVIKDHSKKATKIIKAEKKAQGSVKWSVYKAYFKAAGGVWPLWLCFTAERLSKIASDYWVKNWAEAAKGPANSTTVASVLADSPSPLFSAAILFAQDAPARLFNSLNAPESEVDVGYYIKIYAALGFLYVIMNMTRSVVRAVGTYRAARAIHEQLVANVMSAPTSYFDSTPVGRILNVFSSDMKAVDTQVMMSVAMSIMTLVTAASIIVICSTITPWFLLGLFPLGFIYKWVATMYTIPSRDLKRLNSTTRSPIYAQFSETLNGVATIRAYGQESRFIVENANRVNANVRPFWYMWLANRWFGVRSSFISSVVALAAGSAVVLASDVISSGMAGLALLYVLSFSESLVYGVRFYSMMEMALNSVERIEDYKTIRHEGTAVIEGTRPPADWPSRGAIDVKNLTVRYAADGEPVLKNLTFSINAQEKIGIVGRTGAGKSTLSLAFLRILDHIDGTICIDDIDTSKIGLRDLRSNLTIIPQDPVLFSGTVRSNLDPFNESDDAALWAALKASHFLETLQDAATTSTPSEDASSSLSAASTVGSDDTASLIKPSATPVLPAFTLDDTVTDSGSNFSQGQRQLLCLARALLRTPRVVILDEATASVDNLTDAAIQKTIREDFAHCTVLTVAHRLRTIVDYDRVLVLDKGEVVEYGYPDRLLEIEGGWFRRMCEQTGEMDELVEIARVKGLARDGTTAL
ncbi:P-loop containing nucleoside triphosphate hydrolase protein, partial [Blyttiomyces helicus]